MKTYLDPSEVALLERAATNLRDKLLIRLLFHLGCRVSEVLGLAVEDVDFERGTVTMRHLKTSLRLSCNECRQRLGRHHTFCPKCGRKVTDAQAQQQERRRQRVLPLDTESLGMLREYVSRGGPVGEEGRQPIFGINRHRAWQIVRQSAERAGLPLLINPESGKTHGISPHRLRDSFAIHAVKSDDSGDGLRLLQEQLGHVSFDTTARYRKVAGEELKSWYDRLWVEGSE